MKRAKNKKNNTEIEKTNFFSSMDEVENINILTKEDIDNLDNEQRNILLKNARNHVKVEKNEVKKELQKRVFVTFCVLDIFLVLITSIMLLSLILISKFK